MNFTAAFPAIQHHLTNLLKPTSGLTSAQQTTTSCLSLPMPNDNDTQTSLTLIENPMMHPALRGVKSINIGEYIYIPTLYIGRADRGYMVLVVVLVYCAHELFTFVVFLLIQSELFFFSLFLKIVSKTRKTHNRFSKVRNFLFSFIVFFGI